MKTVSLQVIEFLKRLYQLQSVAETSEWIVSGLTDLFSAENAIICRHDGTNRIITAIVAKHPFSRANLMPQINESGIMSLHPFWDTTFSPDHVVHPLSMVASRKSWHANPLYNEVFRPDGIEDQLNTEILGNARAFTTVNVLRSRRGFSRSEVDLLKLLREHIGQALSNAQRLEEAGVFGSITGKALLVPLDYHGRPKSKGTPAADALANLFPFCGVLPETVRAWANLSIRSLNEGSMQTKTTPLVFADGNRQWEFFIHRDLVGGEYLLVMVPGDACIGLNSLSARESEVMDWVEKGKANEEIAGILGLSINTVKTHLKRAFIKLGVENRTAAVSALKSRSVSSDGSSA